MHNRKIFYSNHPYNIYVEALGNPSDHAMLFIPGGYHTGVCYLTTPDGRPGWATLAAEQGHYALVTDIPGTGRSASHVFEHIDGQFVIDAYAEFIRSLPGTVTIFVHSMSGFIGFKLAEMLPGKIIRVVAIEPSMPGNIHEPASPETESTEYVQLTYRGLPFNIDMTKATHASERAIARFTTEGSKKLLFPKHVANALAQYRASLCTAHPKLLYELLNVNGSKPSLNNPGRLKNTRVLIVTTDDPLHVDDDPKIVDFLRRHDVEVTFWRDGEHGTGGNSHMMMVEQNNHDLFAEIVTWIQQT